jgi:hypothetical protein
VIPGCPIADKNPSKSLPPSDEWIARRRCWNVRPMRSNDSIVN